MKVLLINKYYHDKGKSGGVGRYILELGAELEKRGHQAIPFGCRDEFTIDNPYLKYFPPYFNLERVDFSLAGLKKVAKIFYNREAAKNLAKLIDETKPDVAHLHNIYHHLSPVILKVLKKNKIPVVMTIHDMKLMCPNYSMFHKGRIYERTKKHKYYRCFFDRCIKDSYSASLVLTLEAYFAWIMGYYRNYIAYYIAPSDFMAGKLVEYGFKEKKVVHISNFLSNIDAIVNEEKEKYFVYIGRLSEEKGVDVLIEAVKKLKLGGYKLKIAGSGPSKETLEQMVKNYELEDKVEFLGFLDKPQVENLLKKALFSVVPSIWYENAPYSILESYAAGTAVIGSEIGGISELVIHNETGLLANPADVQDLAQKIEIMLKDPEKTRKMGGNGMKLLEKKYSSAVHLNKVLNLYLAAKIRK